MRNPVAVALALLLAACSANPTGGSSILSGVTSPTSSSSGGSSPGASSSSGGAPSSTSTSSSGGATPTPAPGPTGDTSSGIPCDVDAVLSTNCRQCHGATPAFGASASFMTYAQVQPLAQTIVSRITSTSSPMPPTPYPMLGSGDVSTIQSWVTAGMPQSRDVCAPPADAGAPVVDPLPCTPDTQIKPTSKFAMPSTPGEQYVCYGFDVTPAAKRHVTALAPLIDNPTIVHHLLLFQSPDAVSSTPTPCNAGGSTSWTLIAGWAPGGRNEILPPAAGFPEEGTTHWVMQIHLYNVKGLANQSDGSGYNLCTTDQLRPNDADVFAGGSTSFTIPPLGSLTQTCSFNFSSLPAPINIFSATPHMHLLGKSISSAVVPGGNGTPAPIVNVPNWDFQTQVAYPATNVVNPGDSVQTICSWDNSTSSSVGFGEYTTDEMCFSFLAYYPKITSGGFSWVTPSAFADCK